MHCWPYVEEVTLNTTFSLPHLSTKSAVPLPLNPDVEGGYPFFSEAEIVQNAGFPNSMADLPRPWENNLTSVMNANETSAGDFDLFMEAVIWGKNGFPASELLGEDNAQRLLDRVDSIYGTIMAQLYTTNARIDAAPTREPLNGTAVSMRTATGCFKAWSRHAYSKRCLGQCFCALLSLSSRLRRKAFLPRIHARLLVLLPCLLDLNWSDKELCQEERSSCRRKGYRRR